MGKLDDQAKVENELMLHRMELDDDALNMTIGGSAATSFMCSLVRFFEQNGGKNFLTLSVADAEHSYSITIQNNSGDDSPAKKLKELDELLEASKAGQVSLQKAWEQDKAELTARAEAAEAERDAAVGDWKAYEENGQCDVCKYGEGGGCVYPEGNRCRFEWRGQEAGKGKNDGNQ